MQYIHCSYKQIDELYSKNDKSNFIAFQKKDLDLLNLCKKINNINTHYFQLIETESCCEPFIINYNDKTYIFYIKTNKIYYSEIKYENGYFKYTKPELIITCEYYCKL